MGDLYAQTNDYGQPPYPKTVYHRVAVMLASQRDDSDSEGPNRMVPCFDVRTACNQLIAGLDAVFANPPDGAEVCHDCAAACAGQRVEAVAADLIQVGGRADPIHPLRGDVVATAGLTSLVSTGLSCSGVDWAVETAEEALGRGESAATVIRALWVASQDQERKRCVRIATVLTADRHDNADWRGQAAADFIRALIESGEG